MKQRPHLKLVDKLEPMRSYSLTFEVLACVLLFCGILAMTNVVIPVLQYTGTREFHIH